MPVCIKSRAVGGAQGYAQFESEETGRRMLEELLATQREAGFTVTKKGDDYTITDKEGTVVMHAEFRQA